MAKRLIWSDRAQHDLKEIFTYWNEKNPSTSYSKKLSSRFDNAAESLVAFPHLGRKSHLMGIRFKLVKDYWMVDQAKEEEIIVLLIWDVRRNPEQFNEVLGQMKDVT